MEHVKRMAAGGAWDHLPEEIVSLITVKVAETSEDLLQELRSLRLCNKATKRASSSRALANCFNLKHHFTNRVWSEDDMYKYYQIVDWLEVVNNGRALFINGMSDICMGQPGGVTVLAQAEEGDLQASYVLAIIKYYKHGLIDDVFNHIRCVYGTVTFGSQVGTRWMMEDGDDYDEDDVLIMGVRKRVFDEIVRMRRREHIDPDNLLEIHLLEDGQKCLWKQGCGKRCTPVFCSLRCRIRTELYEFLSRFHTIMNIMDDIEM
jgi:hypothetical protein